MRIFYKRNPRHWLHIQLQGWTQGLILPWGIIEGNDFPFQPNFALLPLHCPSPPCILTSQTSTIPQTHPPRIITPDCLPHKCFSSFTSVITYPSTPPLHTRMLPLSPWPLPFGLWFYGEPSTFYTCYCWLPLLLGVIVGSLISGILTSYCWISRLWYVTGGIWGKKFSCMHSFHLPLSWIPSLSLFLCTSLSASQRIFSCFSVCFSLSYTHRHIHVDTHKIICRSFLWAFCLSHGNRRTAWKEMRVDWGRIGVEEETLLQGNT